MDGASSIIAVISLAIQVGESTKKLIDLWNSVRDAPEDIRRLLQETHTLAMAIRECSEDEKHQLIDPVTELALRSCNEHLTLLRDKLASLTKLLTSLSARQRIWGALKTTFMRAELESLERSLEHVKSTLAIVKMNSVQRALKQILDVIEANATLTQELHRCHLGDGHVFEGSTLPPLPPYELLQQDEDLPSRDDNLSNDQLSYLPRKGQKSAAATYEYIGGMTCVYRTPLGSIRLVSEKRKVVTAFSSESRITVAQNYSYTVRPSPVLKFLGISSGFQFDAKFNNGPQFFLRPFNAVSPDALVFQFCKDGNLGALKTLLDRGEASLRDVDPSGQTPLLIAIQARQPEIVEFLLHRGADAQIPGLVLHRIAWNDACSVEKSLAVFGSLQKYCPYEYETHGVIVHMCLHYRPSKMQKDLRMSQANRREQALRAMVQLLPHLSPSDDVHRAQVLDLMIEYYYEQKVLAWTIRSMPGPLYESDEVAARLKVHVTLRAMKMKLPYRDPESMRLLAERTRNLHRVYDSRNTYTGRRSHLTLTSLAMNQPMQFFPWRDCLLKLDYNIEEFVKKELHVKGSPLAAEGWEQDTLVALFNSNIFLDSSYSISGFFRCGRCSLEEVQPMIVDLPWRRHLRNIRNRRSHDFCCNPGSFIKEIVRPSLAVREVNMFEAEAYDVEDASLRTSDTPGVSYKVDESLIPMRANSNGVGEPWPYVLVCDEQCRDKMCVSTAYENNCEGEPFLPSFVPFVPESESHKISTQQPGTLVEIFEDECPSRKIPGAFME